MANPVEIGQRIELLSMENDPNPIAPGSKGTVTWVNNLSRGDYQIGVQWDNGRTLMLVPDDQFRVLQHEAL